MYNNAIQKYPVQYGDIWTCPDGHAIYCGDMQDIPETTKIDLVYTDPPWNQKILERFYNWGKIYKVLPTMDHFFYNSFLSILKWIIPNECIIFIEIGNTGIKDLRISAGHTDLQLRTFVLRQYAKSTPVTVDCYTLPQNLNKIMELPSTAGMKGAMETISQYPFRQFLDPFAGEGYFVEMAIKNKCVATGIELIPEKCASMIRRLSKYSKFERTGTWLKKI